MLQTLDENNESASYVNAALANFSSLGEEERLLTIFHAWKSGKLELVENVLSPEDTICQEFFRCHHLKIKGDAQASYLRLSKLGKLSSSSIIHYRLAAESLEFENIQEARKRINQILPALPFHRQKPLQFNLGIAACNKTQLNTAEDIIGALAQDRRELSQFFFHWLSGAYHSHLGEHKRSLDHYLSATDLAQFIPSRTTDIGIVAFGALREAFWEGNMEKAKESLSHIKATTRNQVSSLGKNRFTLSTALFDFLEGNIASSTKAFNFIYSLPHWGFEHLQTCFSYLWMLCGLGQPEKMLEVLPRLKKLRDDLGQSDIYYNFDAFEVYSLFLCNVLSASQAHNKLLELSQVASHKSLKFHNDWINGLLLLISVEPFEKTKTIIHFGDYPIIQRIMVCVLSHDDSLNSNHYWNYISQQTSEPIAEILAKYRTAQMTRNLLLFTSQVKKLRTSNFLPWLQIIHKSSFELNERLAHKLAGSHFLLDYDTHQVVALNTLETLDSQPQLAELFLALAKDEQGADKETIAMGLGYQSYDPVQQDSVIYNLLSRLRDWTRRQNSESTITKSPSGWSVGFYESIVKIGGNQKPHLSDGLQIQIPLGIENPRHVWIYNQIKSNGHLTRSELMQKFGVQKSTAANDFNFLIEKNLITRFGSGRGIYYRLAKEDQS